MSQSVAITVTANVGGAIAGLGRLGAASVKVGRQMGTSIGRGLDRLEAVGPQMQQVGSQMQRVGLVGAAALFGLTKAAMDWESQWAGVTKTVDFSNPKFGTAADQASRLEGQLRQMARTMPETHENIAAVAEAAGQLGVHTPDIAEFTRVMIMLGTTTNLTADEAATSLAQFMNVMRTAPEDVGRLGATIVDLGNNGASTEKQIVDMAQRISGAARVVGLSEQQTLGYANALASVGVSAERGGTAISMTFLQLDRAVKGGGAQLQTLAKTAGMTADEFKRAYEQDASGALVSFLQGLNRVRESGGNTSKVLRDLGITGINQTSSLLMLASSGDILTDSLGRADTAWKNNTALVAEAMKRYDTTASKVKIAWNRIKDAAITAGAAILPVVADVADVVGKIASAFGSLPEPVQKSGLILLGLITTAGLVGGSILRLMGTIVQLRGAITAMGVAAGPAGTKLSGLGRAGSKLARGLGIAGIIYTAATALNALLGGLDDTTTSLEDMTRAVADVSSQQGFGALDQQFRDATKSGALIQDSMDGVADAIKRVADESDWDKFEEIVASTGAATSSVAKARAQFDRLDQSLVALTGSGAGDRAQDLFAKMADSARQQGVPLTNLIKLFPNYAAAVRSSADQVGYHIKSDEELAQVMAGQIPPAMKRAQDAAKKAAGGVGDMGSAADTARGQFEQLVDAMDQVANQMLELSGDEIAVEAAIDDVTASIKENGKTLDLNTKKGRANQTALNDLAKASLAHRDALIKQGASSEQVTAATEKARKAWIKAARQLGMNEKDVKRLSQAYFGVPKEVKTTTKTNAKTTQREVDRLHSAYNGLPRQKQTKVAAPGARPSKIQVDQFMRSVRGVPASKRTEIRTIAELAGVEAAKRAVASVKGKTVTVRTNYVSTGNRMGVKAMSASARGGLMMGPGTSISDDIPALLSRGEFVVRAVAVKHVGLEYLQYLNSLGGPQRSFVPRYATGGQAGVLPQRIVQMPARTERIIVPAPAVDGRMIASAVRSGLQGVTFTLDGKVLDVKIDQRLTAGAKGARRAFS